MAASSDQCARSRLWAAVGFMMIAAAAPAATAVPARAATNAAPPRLFYTTNSPPTLKVVNYQASGGGIHIGTPRTVATLPAADGLAFAPDGNLLVGGGITGNIFSVNPDSGAMTSQPSGSALAYHVSVSPDGSKAWTSGLPGQLASVPLKPFGPGAPANVQGDEKAITMIGFAPSGAFFTSSNSSGAGSFGTIDMTTLRTTRLQSGLRGAHGFTYDTFSKNILLFGSFAIVQVDPAQPATPVSQKIVPDMLFDQGTGDGQGHVLAASNTGYLVLVDYSASGKIGDPTTKVSKVYLDNNLDDIVTQGGLVVAPAAAGGGSSKPTTLYALIGVMVVVGVGAALLKMRKPQGERAS